jgi:hypothetical protein
VQKSLSKELSKEAGCFMGVLGVHRGYAVAAMVGEMVYKQGKTIFMKCTSLTRKCCCGDTSQVTLALVANSLNS